MLLADNQEARETGGKREDDNCRDAEFAPTIDD